MHILTLQHAPVEHSGIFRSFLTEDGHSWDTVELDQDEALPDDLSGYDALWVLGGPMDVWQEDAHPWLKAEKVLIRNAVEELGMPYLGLCLGHQLLAEALGGTVGKSARPEIGVYDVQLTQAGAEGVFLDGVPDKFPCLQWHSAEVSKMPAGAHCLATSPDCAVQAMSWGPRAYSLQFHVEIEPDTVANWAAIPEYAASLDAAMGQGGAAKFEQDCNAQMHKFNEMAERVYINWMQTSAQA